MTPEQIKALLGTVAPESPPVIPPEIAQYVSRYQPTNADPTTGDEIEAALSKDRERQGLGMLAQNLSRAGAMFRGEKVGAMSAPALDDNVRSFVMRRQAEGQDEDRAFAKVKGQADAEKAREEARKTGVEIGKLGAETDKTKAETDKTRASIGLDERRFGLDSTKVGLDRDRVGLDGQRLGLDREKFEHDKTKTDKPKPSTPDDLRKEFNGLAVVKDMQTVSASYEKIKGTSGNGPGDISLIFAYMKLLDPGSTVREGEFATAANAGGVDDKVLTTYNRLLQGDKLAPDVRNQFRTEAGKVYQSQKARYDATAKEYARLAEANGLHPSDVVLDLGYEQGAEPAQASAATPARPTRTDPATGETRAWDGKAWVPVGG